MVLSDWKSNSIQALQEYAQSPEKKLYIQKRTDGFKELKAQDAKNITVWETIQKFFGYGPASLANISKFLNNEFQSLDKELKSKTLARDKIDNFNQSLMKLNEKILLAIKTRKLFGKPENLTCMKISSPPSTQNTTNSATRRNPAPSPLPSQLASKLSVTSNVTPNVKPNAPRAVSTSIKQLPLNKIENLKKQHKEQLLKFRQWAREDKWEMFEPLHSHYDWWMFPIDRTSQGHGATYQLNQREIETLKDDIEFMSDYREGVKLVLNSWGWDANRGKQVESPKDSQQWKGYGVRLGKMAESLSLFDETELYDQVKKFYTQVAHTNVEEWVSNMCTKGSAIEYVKYMDNTLSDSFIENVTRLELIKDVTATKVDGVLTVSLSQHPLFNISIRKQNIFASNAEVVVNAANTYLGGGGGIDGLIHEKGGAKYQEAHRQLKDRFEGKYSEGSAVMITSGDLLTANKIQSVIVVAGPTYSSSNTDADQLYSCYYNSLVLAHLQQKKSIAFPSISTGIFGYPKDRAARISLRAIEDFVKRYLETTLKTISIHFLPKDPDSVLSDYEHALGKTEPT